MLLFYANVDGSVRPCCHSTKALFSPFKHASDDIKRQRIGRNEIESAIYDFLCEMTGLSTVSIVVVVEASYVIPSSKNAFSACLCQSIALIVCVNVYGFGYMRRLYWEKFER